MTDTALPVRSIFTRRIAVNVIGLLFLVLLPPVLSFLGQEYLLTLSSRILIYGLAAASLDLILGFGGMVSLGHAAFVGIGGYAVGIAASHAYASSPIFSWPFALPGSENALFVWPVGIVAAALFALVTGSICLRTKGMHFIMITLAFAQMVFYFFVSLRAYGGSDGISLYGRNRLPGMDLGSDTIFYYLCLAVLVVFLVFAIRLTKSRFGRVLQGCRDNEERVQVLGFSSYRYKLICYTLSGAVAGLSGVLLVNQGEFVSPGLVHWTRSGEIMIMVLLGGMGTLIGPVFGAAVLLLMEDFLAMYTEHWMLILGPFLLLVVLFARRGLYGLLTGNEGMKQ